jgi:hypothetical protein
MGSRLSQLLDVMTPQEHTSVEIFSAFLIYRRKLQNLQVLSDDISINEMMELVSKSGSFDWLDSNGEDIYSIKDGEAVARKNIGFGLSESGNRYIISCESS